MVIISDGKKITMKTLPFVCLGLTDQLKGYTENPERSQRPTEQPAGMKSTFT
jgi:hypothetical protein